MEHLRNSPDYHRRLLTEWQKLQRGEKVDSRIVREPIYSSWMRSRGWRVDPDQENVHSIPQEELELLLEEESQLLNITSPVMMPLVDILGKTGNSLVLANAQGIVLKVFSTDERARPQSVKPGDYKREDFLGTAGLSTCLQIREPVEVVAEEHYRRMWHNHTCVAAPVFNSRGEMLGAISVTSNREAFHHHTVPFIRMTAKHISEQFRLHELLAEQKALIEMMDDGIIMLDGNGIITTINSKALSVLGMDLAPAGKSIHSLFAPFLQLKRVEQGQAFYNEEVTIQMPEHASCVCILSFIPKDVDGGGGVLILRDISRMREYASRVSGSKASFTFRNIIGQSSVMQNVVSQARRIARHDMGVLILGESGTGKELFAQAIHNASLRREQPFVIVNCGALPRDLVQSELFGYTEGAFTGASKGGRIGKFELADKGTIFLDEIGEMPMDAQINLLRLIQNQEVMRIGDKVARPVNVRIIAATNRDLQEAVRQKQFREDLLYRLNGFTLRVPPLRERLEDIEELINFFLSRISSRSPEFRSRVFSGSAVEAMKRRTWPGNVRELENAVERAVYMSTGRIIQEEDLGEVFVPQPAPTPEAVRPHSAGAEKSLLEDLMMRYRGNVREAARELGCSKSSLYAKMNSHHVKARDFRILSVPPPAGKKRLSDLSPTQIEKLFKLLGDGDGE